MDNLFLIKIKGGLGVLSTPKSTLFFIGGAVIFFNSFLFAGAVFFGFPRPLCLPFLFFVFIVFCFFFFD